MYLIPRRGYRKKNGKRDSSLLSGSNRVFSVSCNEKINLKPNSERSQENEMLQIREQSWPALEAYFGRAKAAFLCSYCYKRRLWFYDGGRLGRVKIVTLRIGANLKHFHLSSGVSTWRFHEQKHCMARPKETPALQGRRLINIQRIQVSCLCGAPLLVIFRKVSNNFQALYGVYQHGMLRNTFSTAWNIKLLKIIRRELFFNQTSLPRQPQCCCVLSGTVKIRNFKIRKLLQRFISRLPST